MKIKTGLTESLLEAEAGYLHPTGFDTKTFFTRVAKDAVGIAKANTKFDKHHRPDINQLLGSAYDLNLVYAHHFVTRSEPRSGRPEIGSVQAGAEGIPSKEETIRAIKGDPALIRIVTSGLGQIERMR